MRIKLFSGMITNYKTRSNFKSLKQFNTHIENWMIDIKDEFTKSETIALKRLIRFSAKIPGLSNAKVQTIVAATHEKDLGISRRTFFRMLDKAKKCGLLKVEQTKHKSNGKQAHNLFIFQRYTFKQIEPPKETIGTPESVTTGTPGYYQSSKSIIIKNNVKAVPYLDYTFVSDFIPKSFVKLVKPFFDDAETIEKFYNRFTLAVKKQNKNQDYNFTNYSLEILCEDSFRQTIRKLKKNKVKTDMFGYFYGVVKEKLLDLAIEVEGIFKSDDQKDQFYSMIRS